ncbi:MAG: sialate O-acetylesterase [Verrucomicrobia bacterium]|nr:sialate O-acetylesterase [Verrucomicrobiota bacterium]
MNRYSLPTLSCLYSTLALLCLLQSPARADVRLHGLFTDNMVLQRNASVPVWGWADEGEEIVVSFRGHTAKTRAKDGKWMVRLPKLSPGNSSSLVVQGRNRIELKDVLVGEVWIASGQSNMEWPMTASLNPETEIPKTANPLVRLYTVPKLKAMTPTNNVPASWQLCNPSTTARFSAVGYYFGRDLAQALGVPVGIIHTSWGGSPAEVWMSSANLNSNPDYKKDIVEAQGKSYSAYLERLAAFRAEKDAAAKAGQEFKKQAPDAPWRPTELYNGMIAPLLPFAIQGAIWYQGESNAGRAEQYRTLFPDMIRNWRKDWGQGDFPFLLVQLAPFMAIKPEPSDSSWAELREAQWMSTKTLPRVGMAVITDAGDPKDIHPKAKEPAGTRLAIAARKLAYGHAITHSGPEYKSMRITGNRVTLKFDHAKSGLVARGGDLEGFAIAGADRRFVWARAHIQGDSVVVHSPLVETPVAVRYGWADCPVVNLWNAEGLPATPFRTDDFPMVTAGKR